MAKLGEMLVSEGLLTPEQLDEALRLQKTSEGFLGDILVKRGLLSEQQLVEVLVRQTGSPAIDLAGLDLDTTLAAKVPADLARRHRCVPVKQNGQVLHVAMANPADDRALDALAFASGCTIKTFVAGSAGLEAALTRLYGGNGGGGAHGTTRAAAPPAGGGDVGGGRIPPDTRKAGAPAALQALPDLPELDRIVEESVEQITDPEAHRKERSPATVIELGAGEAPVIRLVNALLVRAVQMRASDIHLEPQESAVRARFRIDGSLVQVAEFPAHAKQGLVSRIKILASLDISEKRIPQDGRFKVQLTEAQAVDFRVNVLPTIHGEKVVIRLLGQGELKGSIEELGFAGKNLEAMRDCMRSPLGMILVTGPTGSGKTTTLYTILSELNRPDTNIVTAEDPVEYHLQGITQVSVRPAIGFTFDVALRAFLRQDPNVILVGEIRDFETAQIATKAALTGHLVLSTLHTNDCPSTVVRLVDMGLEPFLVASAVKVVVAQRLVRRICTECREEMPISEAERKDLDQSTLSLLEALWRGKGCGRCNGLGYRGRAPVYEVMPVKTREMKRVITEGGTEIQVAQVARREGVRSLRDEALRMVNEGLTSLEEGMKIIMID